MATGVVEICEFVFALGAALVCGQSAVTHCGRGGVLDCFLIQLCIASCACADTCVRVRHVAAQYVHLS